MPASAAPRTSCLSGVAALLVLASCTGSIEHPSSAPRTGDVGTDEGKPRPGGDGPVAGGPSDPGPGPHAPPSEPASAAGCAVPIDGWRRLTRFEYENTLRELFPGADAAGAAALLPADTIKHRFDNEATAQSLSPVLLEGYLKAAERLSAAVTNDLDKLLDCRVAEKGEESCVTHLLGTLGTRIFRRPLRPDERDRLLVAHRAHKADGGFRFAVEGVLQRLLVSPQFVHRIEQAGPSGALDGYALASRLAYTLWAGPPDAELLAAAASGALLDRAELRRHAERMLADKRSQLGLGRFFDQLYDLPGAGEATKDKELYPHFTASVARLMREETTTFLRHLVTSPDARTEDLLMGTDSFVDKTLAAYYGVSGPTGATFQRTALPPQRRAGLMGQGFFSVLTSKESYTSPIDRGKFVRTRLMCDELPEPPPNVPEAPEFTGKETMRELLAKHASEPSCNVCHRLIDPIGLGFENLDPSGRWRERDVGGQAIDASGEVVGGDVPGAFRGPAELGQRLARSARVRQCFTEHLYAYAFGREPTAADGCFIQNIEAARLRDGGSGRALVRALVDSPVFSTRARQP